MAVYQYKFKVEKEHSLQVDHPFKGNVVLTLDGKQVKSSAAHTFSYNFDVEGKSCKLEIALEVQDFGMAKMQSWVHRFFVDGVSVKAGG
jgi:hypothetical protein